MRYIRFSLLCSSLFFQSWLGGCCREDEKRQTDTLTYQRVCHPCDTLLSWGMTAPSLSPFLMQWLLLHLPQLCDCLSQQQERGPAAPGDEATAAVLHRTASPQPCNHSLSTMSKFWSITASEHLEFVKLFPIC